MRNMQPLLFRWFKCDLPFTFSDVMNKLAYWDPGFGWKSFTVRYKFYSQEFPVYESVVGLHQQNVEEDLSHPTRFILCLSHLFTY
jgi:hypothetical protein